MWKSGFFLRQGPVDVKASFHRSALTDSKANDPKKSFRSNFDQFANTESDIPKNSAADSNLNLTKDSTDKYPGDRKSKEFFGKL